MGSCDNRYTYKSTGVHEKSQKQNKVMKAVPLPSFAQSKKKKQKPKDTANHTGKETDREWECEQVKKRRGRVAGGGVGTVFALYEKDRI